MDPMNLRLSQWWGWAPKVQVSLCTQTCTQTWPDMLISAAGYSAFTSTQASTNNTLTCVSTKRLISILFSPDGDGSSLLAHTQISSICRHTHNCKFLGISICSKTARLQILGSVFALLLGRGLNLSMCGSPFTHW